MTQIVHSTFNLRALPAIVLLIAVSLPSSASEDLHTFVDRLMQTQIAKLTDRYSRMDMLDFVSKHFMETHNIDPRVVELNYYGVTDYEIVGAGGPYVDVSIENAKCKVACNDTLVLRLKVVKESGHYALVPGRYDDGYVDYWWKDMIGAYNALSDAERSEPVETLQISSEMESEWQVSLDNQNADDAEIKRQEEQLLSGVRQRNFGNAGPSNEDRRESSVRREYKDGQLVYTEARSTFSDGSFHFDEYGRFIYEIPFPAEWPIADRLTGAQMVGKAGMTKAEVEKAALDAGLQITKVSDDEWKFGDRVLIFDDGRLARLRSHQ